MTLSSSVTVMRQAGSCRASSTRGCSSAPRPLLVMTCAETPRRMAPTMDWRRNSTAPPSMNGAARTRSSAARSISPSMTPPVCRNGGGLSRPRTSGGSVATGNHVGTDTGAKESPTRRSATVTSEAAAPFHRPLASTTPSQRRWPSHLVGDAGTPAACSAALNASGLMTAPGACLVVKASTNAAHRWHGWPSAPTASWTARRATFTDRPAPVTSSRPRRPRASRRGPSG